MAGYLAEIPDEEDEINELAYTSQKEAMLFLIDVSDSMLERNAKGRCAARTALECAFSVLTNKVFSAPNDMVGIVLYNTKVTKLDGYSANNREFMHILVDLDQPGKDPVKTLRDLLEFEDRFQEVCQPSDAPASPAELLALASRMITERAPRFNFKRIILITDNDDPLSQHRSQTQAFKTRAKDLYGLGIKIEPIFLSGDVAFDAEKFWEDIIERTSDDESDLVFEGEARLADMQDSIKALQTPKRAVFSVPMEIAPGLTIGIKGYILYKEQKIMRSTHVSTTGLQPKEAAVETTYLCEDTAAVLEKEQIKQAYKFGKDDVVFEPKEIKQMKAAESPVLRIIGFKAMDKLAFWHNLTYAYFVYPHEVDFVGSIRTFAALHRSLLRRKQFALCWFIPRRNTAPFQVAMMASELELSSNGKSQLSPPGFFLIRLPCADDIRQPPRAHVLHSADLSDLMGNVIDRLRTPPYDPARRSNPSLQWHYKALQAMAVNADVPVMEEHQDETLPNYRAIHKRAGKEMAEWHEALEAALDQQEDVHHQAHSAPAKRKANSPSTSSKKIKADPDAPSLEELRQAARANTLKKYKVAELKAALQAHKADLVGTPAGMLKQDLMDFFEKQLA